MDKRMLLALGIGCLLGLSGVVRADDATEANLKARVASLEARLAQVQDQQDQNWLNARRAQEVKALVREVLSDADTRASLAASGATAGYQNGFFIASDDGTFLMKVNGQIDFRYMNSFQQTGGSNGDQKGSQGGFELTRTYLTFSGHVADPRIGYFVRLVVDRNTNAVGASVIKLSYKLADNLTLFGGEFKDTFEKEDMIEASNQLAVERSLVSYIMGTGYVQGLGVNWDATDNVRLTANFNDGMHSGQYNVDAPDGFPASKDFAGDQRAFGITARGDVKLAGDWSQADDFTSWGGDPMAAFIGAAVHYDEPDPTPTSLPRNKVLAWTVDGQYKNQGWGVFASLTGAHELWDQNLPESTTSIYGVVAQASYNINDKVEPFGRWEFLYSNDLGPNSRNSYSFITAGVNIYQQKHNAKFSLDVLWALDPVDGELINTLAADPRATAVGLLQDANGERNQLVLRAQYQLLF